ncbi:RNA polymerase sigma factor [Herbaspirillum sp. alder98]|uniref:RNA polymerase sigma factor n=1 Tax=Herbaspirillum sp. alder98 TaxID=2913096 RepID=UPI001CD86A1F|nr:RNA polymerase sigma factor [Herbaspirillum sp. alder98]MCA1325673.1 RNA polymerase sigma factor [Herbaspirillum sp. alder98]
MQAVFEAQAITLESHHVFAADLVADESDPHDDDLQADQSQDSPEHDQHAAADEPADAAPAPQAVQIDVVALYTQHRTHLLRFVQRYVGSHEDAEDVVQNTFIEAMKCAHRFSGLSKPSTWLFGIALNLARNQVRRNTADRYEMVDENFMEQLVDASADPAMAYELRQIAQKVDDLLSELSPQIRNTFEAVLDGDATYEEAAQQLSIPIGTVRSRVSRVRAAVRNEYGNSPVSAKRSSGTATNSSRR